MHNTKQMPTKYQPQAVEQGKYQKWVEGGYFQPSGNPDAKPYSIVIPPPNVTGKLHLGHAWDVTLQDIIIRQKRMQGYDTLWLPGMDHAGIATQAKVEAKLAEDGISRYDLGREAFVDKVWEWKEDYAKFIREQWAKMGVSVDYSRERFTLDEGLSEAVRKVFVTLYEKGLIYRGAYLINWDPQAKTALSDIEVIHKEVNGAFFHFRYPLADGSGFVELATTRPETMLGDTAVAVHPEDERYQNLIGKTILLPLVGREIPIIADEYVDREFGTGVVKITPAHDPNDFEVGLRHHLPQVNVMNDDATMNEEAGPYQGMDRFEARKSIVKDMEEQGYLVKVEEMVHSVGHSERTDVVVEPRISTQWFVRMKPLAERAIQNQVTEDKVNFFPERFEGNFLRWMENIHDWVISRQLWWGHQIPAWYHKETGEMYVGMEVPADLENWEQDPDVLDTWFSSALWPFSTMGWPDEESADFQRYFPTSTLVTGYDIISFWVSRMIFQSLEFTGRRPFENVLIHGLIRDEEGRKMSKSLGNGIDPMDIVEQYGADALRWFLANGSSPGQDVRFSYEKMDAAWNFINKIWNASRYVLLNSGEMEWADIDISGTKTTADKWILSRLNKTIAKVTELFERFEFGEAGRVLYHFIWDDYCDWYIEMTKEVLQGEDEEAKRAARSILLHVLDNILRLMHPIMPFVTEEIWQNLPHEGETLVKASYPTVNSEQDDDAAELAMDKLIGLIKAVRILRSERNTPISKQIPIKIRTTDAESERIFRENEAYITRFCNPDELEIAPELEAPADAVTAVISGGEVLIPLAGLVNLGEELQRLEGEAQKLQKEVERVSKKLANEKFVAKAPEAVVEGERAKEKDYREKLAVVEGRITVLKSQL